MKEENPPLPVLSFYVKRVFRIYPAYIFAITFSLFLLHFFHPENLAPFSEYMKQFWRLTLSGIPKKEIVNTYLLVGPHFNADLIDAVVWSLVVEMKISFLLPFFIIIARRTNLLFDLGFLIIMLCVFSYEYLGIFYMGILLAKYKKELISIAANMTKGSVTIIILASVLLYSTRVGLKFINSENTQLFYVTTSYLVAMASSMVIIVVLARTKLQIILRKKIFSFLGAVSYSFYLLHWPILLFMLSLISDKYPYNFPLIFIGTLGLTSILSYSVYKFIEMPFQKFGNFLIDRYPVIGSLKFL
jgi:peptidoglycan/LPS O-acetylase OafA/YrhL